MRTLEVRDWPSTRHCGGVEKIIVRILIFLALCLIFSKFSLSHADN